MKMLRQIHLYLGCLFAPLIIYFSLSGIWQIFRFNDLPKESPPTFLSSILHELSKPHTHSTLPTLNSKTDTSPAFNIIALLMGLGIITTSAIGIALALRSSRSSRIAALCIGLGILLPICLLFLHSQ